MMPTGFTKHVYILYMLNKFLNIIYLYNFDIKLNDLKKNYLFYLHTGICFVYLNS